MEEKNVDNQQKEFKLDYSLNSVQRVELVKKICAETDPAKLTPRYLTILSDYILLADREERKKEKDLMTDNRLVTINKHETSYQGLVSKLENGEDGLFNMMTDSENKNIILTPKMKITPRDYEEIPELKAKKEAIDKVKEQISRETGKKKFLLKQQLIEMYKEQYVIKNEIKPPMYCLNVIKSFRKIDFGENYSIDAEGMPHSDGLISFFNWEHISALLCNYSKLKEDSWGGFWGDSWYLLEDLDILVESALKEKYPLYYDLVIYKIDGKSNLEIQKQLEIDHGIKHSMEYLSSLWRNKIPKIIALQAQKDFLNWYYTEKEYGKWKRCSRCGEIKLAHKLFFSTNKGSKDGWYSICKDCRNKK